MPDSFVMEERRAKFFHPYSPYEIQLQFMNALYECLEAGKVAIFESPTGTSMEMKCCKAAQNSKLKLGARHGMLASKCTAARRIRTQSDACRANPSV